MSEILIENFLKNKDIYSSSLSPKIIYTIVKILLSLEFIPKKYLED